MKRVLVTAGAIMALGVITAVGVAAVSRTSTSSMTTLRLVEKEQSFHFVDVPPTSGPDSPPSQGDSFVLTSTLWTKAGKRAGTLRASCVVTSGGNGTVTCYGTFGLKGGRLAAMTTIRGESRTTRIAIVGGTGAYAGARGEMISVQRPGEDTPSDDVFRFTTG
jgi:hypothetical protein